MASVIVICAIVGGLWAARRPRRLWIVATVAAAAVAAVLWIAGAAPAMNYLASLFGAQGMSDAEATVAAVAHRTGRRPR